MSKFYSDWSPLCTSWSQVPYSPDISSNWEKAERRLDTPISIGVFKGGGGALLFPPPTDALHFVKGRERREEHKKFGIRPPEKSLNTPPLIRTIYLVNLYLSIKLLFHFSPRDCPSGTVELQIKAFIHVSGDNPESCRHNSQYLLNTCSKQLISIYKYSFCLSAAISPF